jgi:hypothetical protein
LAKYDDNNFVCNVNSGATGGPTPVSTIGLFVCDRPSSTTLNNYWNGTLFISSPSASVGVENVDMYIGAAGSNFNTTKTLSEAHFGGSLGATLNLALYNRLRTYMTAVGVP